MLVFVYLICMCIWCFYHIVVVCPAKGLYWSTLPALSARRLIIPTHAPRIPVHLPCDPARTARIPTQLPYAISALTFDWDTKPAPYDNLMSSWCTTRDCYNLAGVGAFVDSTNASLDSRTPWIRLEGYAAPVATKRMTLHCPACRDCTFTRGATTYIIQRNKGNTNEPDEITWKQQRCNSTQEHEINGMRRNRNQRRM